MVAREVKAGAEYSEISDARKSTFCSELRGDLATLTAVGCTAPAGPCGGPAVAAAVAAAVSADATAPPVDGAASPEPDTAAVADMLADAPAPFKVPGFVAAPPNGFAVTEAAPITEGPSP
jgi:hypothetical protein